MSDIVFEGLVQKQAAVTKTWNNRKIVLSEDGTLEWFKCDSSGERLNYFNLTGGNIKVEGDRINIRSHGGKSFACRFQDPSLLDEFLLCADQCQIAIDYNVQTSSRRSTLPSSSSSSSSSSPSSPFSPPSEVTTITTTTTTTVVTKNRGVTAPSSSAPLQGLGLSNERKSGGENYEAHGSPAFSGISLNSRFSTKREVTSSGKALVKVWVDPVIVEALGMGVNYMVKYIPIAPGELVLEVLNKIKTKLFNSANATSCESSDWKLVLSGSGKLLDLNSSIVLADVDDIYVMDKSTNRAHVESLFYEAFASQSKMEGYLQKKGQNRQNWKVRYFVIDKEGLLSYFPDKQKTELIGSPILVRGSIVTENRGEVIIKTPTRALHLRGGTQTLPEEMERWKEVFQYHAQRAPGSAKIGRKPTDEVGNRSPPGSASSSPTPARLILKAYIDDKIMKDNGLGDDFVSKSLSLRREALLEDLKGAVAQKLRVDKSILEDAVVYDVSQGVILHENTKVGELKEGCSVLILHSSTNPVSAEEKYLHVPTKEGFLQKRGQSFHSWKTRFFVLGHDGTLKYYEDDKKSGEPLGVVYVRGAELVRTEKDILIKSLTGRELYLRAAVGESEASLDDWFTVLTGQSKKSASNEIAGAWKAIDRDGSSFTTEVGGVVRIRVSSSEGVDLGFVMARADGHFAIYKVGEDIASSIPAFSFQKWRRRKFRGNGKKEWEIYGFRNAKTNTFISRSHTTYKLRGSSTFDEMEYLDISTEEWKIFGYGMAEQSRIGYSLKDPGMTLLSGSPSSSLLSFREEWGGGNKEEWVTLKDGEGIDGGGGVVVSEEKRLWDILAIYLISQKLKQIKTLPHVIECEKEKMACPALPGTIVRVKVLKRFNSRKLPHMIELEMSTSETRKFIFKEDDDISMDMTVMDLLRLANKVWEKAGCEARILTYTVVATANLSGFCECISGDTMLKYDAEAIDNQLGSDPRQWRNFFTSLFAVITTTAAFDITDRHHNNVMFSPDGEVCLIDLSASLGFKAPMDSTLSINPIYFPDRFLKLREYYVKRRADDQDFEEQTGMNLIDWYKFEAMCMQAYYALFTDPVVRAMTAQFRYEVPTPLKFLKYLTDRKEEGKNRSKEAIRNQIVTKMEESDTVARVVATITSVIPMN